MNEQLLPKDTELTAQLARRAAGKLPDGLLNNVMAAVDAAPVRPATRFLPAIPWRTPRFALGATASAFAAVLVAVLVVAPLMQSHPAAASYPAGRALTTSELASLMSGPALELNTPIVASATIDANSDVCPMNRYRTLGVLEAMKSQVCVMDPGSYTGVTGSKSTGIFAFRYLGPGVLGLIGEVSSFSGSELAYSPTADWPLAGKTFVVEGWLGSQVLCDKEHWVDPQPGELLFPTGQEPCSYSWISDKAAPYAFMNSAQYHSFGTPTPSGVTVSNDWAATVDDLRPVGAGGMRFYDSVAATSGSPVHGTWLVRSAVGGPCPGSSLIDSRGCDYWLVLAKLGDLPLPKATPAPTAVPSATRVTGTSARDSADSPLTTAELGLALKAGIPSDNVVIANTAIVDSKSCTTSGLNVAIGAIQGLVPEVCVLGVNDSDPAHRPATQAGTFALKVLAPNLVGYVATVATNTIGRAFLPDETWPEGKSIAVSGWIITNPGSDPAYGKCEGLTGNAASSLDPQASLCLPARLLTSEMSLSISPPQEGAYVAQALTVDQVVALKAGATATASAPVHGSWLVSPLKHDGTGVKPLPSATGVAGCCKWQITAAIEPVALASAASMPTAGPSVAASVPAGVIAYVQGAGGMRIMPATSLPLVFEASNASVVGRIAVVKGPVPASFACSTPGSFEPNCSHLASTDMVAGDGVWAVTLGADGTVEVVGKVWSLYDDPKVTLETMKYFAGGADEKLFVVGAVPGKNGSGSYLSTSPATTVDPTVIPVQEGAYETFGAAEGLFLVRFVNGRGEVVSRLADRTFRA